MQGSRVPLVLLLLTAVPSAAAPQTAAQKEAFFDTLLPFYRSLTGAYGDEGTELAGHIETMAAALTGWDATIADAERELRAQLRGADPRTALQTHTVLASMYLDRGRFEDAVRELDENLRIDPTRAVFHRIRGLALQALDRPRDAAAAFRAAWQIDPADPQNAYHLLVHGSGQAAPPEIARALEALGTVESSLVRGERERADVPFLSLRPIDDEAAGAIAFAPAAYARAFALLLNGQLEAGLTALRQAASNDSLVTDPALRSEPAVRGMAALRQGQVGQALRQLEAAVTLAPRSAEARRILGTAYWVSGDLTQSLEQLRDAVRLDPLDERAWLALSRVLDGLGEWTEAAAVLRKAVASLPESGELRWQLSTISGKRQRTDEADLELMAVADRLVLLAGKGDLIGRIAGLAQAHLEYDRAVALLEQRVTLTPNNASAHQALGRAYVEQGREGEGYAELVVALWLDPSNAETRTAIGRLHVGAGRYAAAVETLTRTAALPPASATAPASAAAVHVLGEALTRAGRTAEGRTRLEEAERLRARDVELQRRLRTAGMLALEAERHRTSGEYDRAIEAWQQVLSLEGRSAAAHLRLADVLVAAKRMDEAAAQLVMAIEANGGAEAHRRLALVYAAMGRADEAARERRLYTEERLKELRER
jgi:tetratricopeptide (TPR) repeat protein